MVEGGLSGREGVVGNDELKTDWKTRKEKYKKLHFEIRIVFVIDICALWKLCVQKLFSSSKPFV